MFMHSLCVCVFGNSSHSDNCLFVYCRKSLSICTWNRELGLLEVIKQKVTGMNKRLYVYVCMCLLVYACMYMCVCFYMYASMHVCMCMHDIVCVSVCNWKFVIQMHFQGRHWSTHGHSHMGKLWLLPAEAIFLMECVSKL